MGAAEHLPKPRHARRDRDRQPDRGPQRVAPADPVPHLEHAAGIDPELHGCRAVGGHRHEVPGDRGAAHGAALARTAGEPPARGSGVRHRLLRGEGLGCDDEQRAGGVEPREGRGQVHAVDVGDEVHPRPAGMRRERAAGHPRAEIRPADADVHDVGDPLAGVAAPFPRTHRFGEAFHRIELAFDAGAHGVIDLADRRLPRISQQGVQHRAVFGGVDARAREHRACPLRHPGLDRERTEQAHRLSDHPVPGVVEQDPARAQRKVLEPIRVALEEIAHVQRLDQRVMRGESAPRGGIGEIRHEVPR